MFRSTGRHVALAVLALAALLAGSLFASDALARRGSVKPKYVLTSLRDLVADLVGRVDAIEETDCGCPGVVEAVCVNGRTYLNFCEAACVLARQGQGDFEDMIQFGVQRGTGIHGGPCEASLPICGDSVCSPGHICMDGECVVDRCNGFREVGEFCREDRCPRGFHCTAPGEACGSRGICDPTSGAVAITATCYPVCVPDESE